MDKLPQSIIDARREADRAADAQLAIWDNLSSVPSFDEIMVWMEERDKFHAAQAHFIQLLWKFQTG